MQTLRHSGWAVTSVDSTAYTVDRKGNTVYGARVQFRTSNQNEGSVFVEDQYLNPDNVTRAVNERAAVMDTIASLEVPPEAVNV